MNINEDYSDAHLFLTGGTGFFGRALLRNWISQAQSGYKIPRVCVLSRNPEKFLYQYPEFIDLNWLKFYRGDILIPETLPKKQFFTHVLHAATESTVGLQLSPLDRYIQIMDGTRNILNFAVAHKIPRVLLTSSGGVYGPQPNEMKQITEDYLGVPNPLMAQNAYSIAKRSAEHLCVLYEEEYGLSIVIARCFAFVGIDLPRKVHYVIGNLIEDALNEKFIRIKGDGKTIRTYLDQRDLAVWLCAILINGRSGEAYNVGSDQPITIKELANKIREKICPEKKILILNNEININNRNRYIPSIVKIQNELNMKIKYNLEESIQEIKENYFKLK
jgi:dTDP-glucose 4,6-dehydratase